MRDLEAYKRAKEKAEAKFAFYRHLGAYVLVCTLLLLINLVTAPGYIWAVWPILGWGIAVFFHGLRVFYWEPSVSEHMIERELAKGA